MNAERQKNPERTWLPGISAEYLSAVVQSSPLGFIVFDLDGIVRFWNRAAQKISGWREDEVLGQSIKVLSEDSWEANKEFRRRTLQKEIFTSVPVRAVKKDGTIMQISYSAAVVYDAEKRTIGTGAIFFDITEKESSFPPRHRNGLRRKKSSGD